MKTEKIILPESITESFIGFYDEYGNETKINYTIEEEAGIIKIKYIRNGIVERTITLKKKEIGHLFVNDRKVDINNETGMYILALSKFLAKYRETVSDLGLIISIINEV